MLMDLLVLLAENAGQVVSKDQILDQLWQGQLVGESALTRNIAVLRGLLGDSTRQPRYIETITKRGYRLIAPVQPARLFAQPTLAVLPFENLNRDPEEDYFADGMSDALTTELGNISSLRVISRQSVLRLKGAQQSVAEIARDLKVDAVLEGSALRAGNRVRVTAQLIQVEPERHLWAQSYECKMSDILAVQGRVAHAVAESVQAALTPSDLARLSRPLQVNPKAHLAYLKARYHYGKWTKEGGQKGLQYLHEAMQEDPSYAPPHALLAWCLTILGFWGHLPIRPAYAQARVAAVKALALDESLSEGHVALAFVKWFLDWDLPGCEREIRRAIELNPSSELARSAYSLFLVAIPRDRERALEQARLAVDLDPLSLNMNFSLAWILFFAGEYGRAIDQAQRTLELYPDSLMAHQALGWACLARSMPAQAIAAFEKAVGLSRDAGSVAALAYAYGRSGQESAAQALLNELLDKSAREYVPAESLALIYTGLNDWDRAFEWLERCYEERDPHLFWIRVFPVLDRLRSDPRFDALLRRLGLPA